MRLHLHRFNEFLFRPDSDAWLSILRIGLGAELVCYCLSIRTDWVHMLEGGGHGLISRDLTEAVSTFTSPYIPILTWMVKAGDCIGLTETSTLQLSWTLLFAAGCMLVLGLFSRSAAIVAWFLHLCAVKSTDFMAYGIDNFTTIGLFYLMLAPLPDRLTLDARIWKTRRPDAGNLGFHRRLLQVHVCFIYFFSGLTKCLGAGWWNGESLWRALSRPPFDLISPQILISWRHFLPASAIMVCLIETSYPFLIWPRKTRLILLGSALALHIGIGLTMGLYLFALIMIVLNLAAFGPGIVLFNRAAVLPGSTIVPSARDRTLELNPGEDVCHRPDRLGLE